MEHSFDIDIATQYGIEEAIILNNIRHWLARNKANNSNVFEGRHRTYNSAEAFHKIFPYMSPQKIQRTLLVLEKKGILKSGAFNSDKWNRTKYYTIVEDTIFNSNETNVKNNGNIKINTFIKNDEAFIKNDQCSFIKNDESYIDTNINTNINTPQPLQVVRENFNNNNSFVELNLKEDILNNNSIVELNLKENILNNNSIVELNLKENNFNINTINNNSIVELNLKENNFNINTINNNSIVKETLKENISNNNSIVMVNLKEDVSNINTINNNLNINTTISSCSSEGKEKEKKEKFAAPKEVFDAFWKAYPRKTGKALAEKSFNKIVKSIDDLLLISFGLNKFKKQLETNKTEIEFIPHASTWLNQKRFLDYEEMYKSQKQTQTTTENKIIEQNNNLKYKRNYDND